MIDIAPTVGILGATVTGVDLSRPLPDVDFDWVPRVLDEPGLAGSGR